jgi:hypothetical protein
MVVGRSEAMMECRIVYFEEPGKKNTNEVFRIARARAEELGIKTILIASITGETAVKAMDAFKGFRVVVVTHNTGYLEPNMQQFSEENAKLVRSKGGILLTTTSAFGGLSRAMGQSSLLPPGAAYVIGDIVANSLRVFGQGMKVACEIAAMAADSGLVRTDEEVISIAGTNLGLGETARGADTAVVIQPANVNLFFQTQVKEILCKPRELHNL